MNAQEQGEIGVVALGPLGHNATDSLQILKTTGHVDLLLISRSSSDLVLAITSTQTKVKATRAQNPRKESRS